MARPALTLDPTARQPIGAAAGPGRLLLLLMAICFLAHFNRISITLAADLRLMERYQIATDQMGAIYSAFLVTYTLVMIPAGWLIDRLGTRFSLALVSFGSAAFVLLTGCVGLLNLSSTQAVAALVVIRALMGIVSAPLHPAAAKAVSMGIPAARRTVANGMVTGAALLGVTATYVVFARLIDWFDWPTAFGIAASITALVGAVWALRGANSRDVGSRTKTTADAQRAEAIPEISETAFSPETPTDIARRHRNLALLTVSYGAAGYLQYLFFYWMHYYFESILRLDEDQCRGYSAMATLAMGAGMVLGGWLSDSLARQFGTRVARGGLAMTAMVVSSLLVVMGITAEAPHWVAIWLALAMGSLGLAEGPFWVTAVEIGGKRGGFSASIVNTGGNAGGILAPFLTPLISDTWGLGWQVGIAVGSGICFAGGLMWYGIDLGPRKALTDHQ